LIYLSVLSSREFSTWFEALGGEVEREDVYPGRPNTDGIWRGQTDRWITCTGQSLAGFLSSVECRSEILEPQTAP
jgi:hypothetical protein